MSQPIRAAFYDFDGTLVSSNVVTRYAFFAKNHPSRIIAFLRYIKLLVTIPFWIGLDIYSRRLFNLVFYREYRGMNEDWLSQQSEKMFDRDIIPKVYPGAESLLEADRKAGFRLVLVSGGLDFALAPVVRHFGFDDLICNRLVYQQGVATGESPRRCLPSKRSLPRLSDSAASIMWTQPDRRPTPTAIRTYPCWKQWASRPPSTPAVVSGESLRNEVGRS